MGDTAWLSREVVAERVDRHRRFVDDRGPEDFGYESAKYGFPVMTAQEREMIFYEVESVGQRDDTDRDTVYVASHSGVEDSGDVSRPGTNINSE